MPLCMYCGDTSMNYGMYLVRRAYKPKNAPFRWRTIGYCCESCEAKGKPTSIEYEENQRNVE